MRKSEIRGPFPGNTVSRRARERSFSIDGASGHRKRRTLSRDGRSIMATERQIAANKANASRSSGPRTALGKSRSRLNATTHNLAERVGPTPRPSISFRISPGPPARWAARAAARWRGRTSAPRPRRRRDLPDRAVRTGHRRPHHRRPAARQARLGPGPPGRGRDDLRPPGGRSPLLASSRLQATALGGLADRSRPGSSSIERWGPAGDWSESEVSRARLDLIGVALDRADTAGRRSMTPEEG